MIRTELNINDVEGANHMILCQACITDTSVTLFAVTNLDPKEPTTYTLLFYDLPTGTKEELVFQSENEAILTFAAWLVNDEESFDVLDHLEKNLHDRIKNKKFLP